MGDAVANNIALAKKLSEHPSGEFDGIYEHIADDMVFSFTAADYVPGSGEHRGKDALINFLTRTRNELVEDDVRLERPLEYFGNGDRVLVLGKESYTVKKTGKKVSEEFVMVLDFRDSQLTGCTIIQNTTALAEAYRNS